MLLSLIRKSDYGSYEVIGVIILKAIEDGDIEALDLLEISWQKTAIRHSAEEPKKISSQDQAKLTAADKEAAGRLRKRKKLLGSCRS